MAEPDDEKGAQQVGPDKPQSGNDAAPAHERSRDEDPSKAQHPPANPDRD